MTNRRLRIGRIAYANLFPIFYILQRDSDCSKYEFIDGVPSGLNRLVREGRIDISPSSSIEYMRNRDRYILINGHSISSEGPVGSIFLFSRRPIETLAGLDILTSSQSETSTALLEIILKEFYEIDCRLRPSGQVLEEAIRSNTAYLLIGDEALIEARKWHKLYIYDLGELWYRYTGLPFVFALWITGRDCCVEEKELFERFRNDLNHAKETALKDLSIIAEASPLRAVISEDELVSYWKGISYDLKERHMKGLGLFEEYLKKYKLI